MTQADDSERYRIYLQQQLLDPLWKEFFTRDSWKRGVQQHSERLLKEAQIRLGAHPDLLEEYRNSLSEYATPGDEFDLPHTRHIFGPILAAVCEAAAAIGLRLERRIDLITSTSISAGPVARPTTGVHALFVGPATSFFCNYWAKAFTEIVTALAASGPPYERIEREGELLPRLEPRQEGIRLATRLALYDAIHGTTLGFGEVQEPRSSHAYRVQLLLAMETFAVAHEFAHLLAYEAGLDSPGETVMSQVDLELFCDAVALQISRQWGMRNENWLAFCGIGALVFFSAVYCSDQCRELLLRESYPRDSARSDSSTPSHPPFDVRLGNVHDWVTERTAIDQREQVEGFLHEYTIICSTLRTIILDIVEKALSLADREGTQAQAR